MPKIHFLNEVVTVEAPVGTSLLDAARDADINLFIGFCETYHCDGNGTCGGAGCKVWVNELEPGALAPKRWRERLRWRLVGTQRLACQAAVRGDCEVRTLPTAMQCAPDPTWEPDERRRGWHDRLTVARPRARGTSHPPTQRDKPASGAERLRRSSGGATAVAPDARVGTLVDGRYRVLEVLGSGGMGVVYLAEHVHIQRKVALKLLHSVLTQFPEVGARFEREAVAIGRIDHPNCVGISDFGRLDDGSMYLVMDLVDGESLGEILDREERLPWRRALAIGRHVLRGIGHAHEVGVVHRDIKPDNIIVAPRGGDLDAATIVDFGIAKLVDGGGPAQPGYRPITQQGTAFGTPTYMSPEQAAGGAIDGRADLYSLSVVMYELIAGRPPFLGDTGLDVVAMHLRAEPPRFAELDAPVAVPAAVERVLRRGLAKAPADRFAAASEYLAAIDRCL